MAARFDQALTISGLQRKLANPFRSMQFSFSLIPGRETTWP
jgi:hypothetical protein